MWSNCFHTDTAVEIEKGKPIVKWGRKVMDLLTQTARLPGRKPLGSFCFSSKGGFLRQENAHTLSKKNAE